MLQSKQLFDLEQHLTLGDGTTKKIKSIINKVPQALCESIASKTRNLGQNMVLISKSST